jgi:hypothetical protein
MLTAFIISHHPRVPVAIKDNFNILDNFMMQECPFAKLTNPKVYVEFRTYFGILFILNTLLKGPKTHVLGC